MDDERNNIFRRTAIVSLIGDFISDNVVMSRGSRLSRARLYRRKTFIEPRFRENHGK